MNKRTEIPEYIGFQMSKNKWIEVVNPRYDTYKWLNRGASGHAYVNRNKVVKIIEGNEYQNKKEFIENCEKEINFQERAAKYGLAPKVFYKGFIDEPFFIKTIPYYYYVVMEYLSPNEWVNLYSGDDDKLLCKFISDLVDKAGLINNFDPLVHIYKNNKNKVVMIDYGRCIDCKEDTCKKQMADALNDTLYESCSKFKNYIRTRRKSHNKSPNRTSKSHNKSPNRTSKSRSKSPKSPKSRSKSPKSRIRTIKHRPNI